jgi:hypothetical protein
MQHTILLRQEEGSDSRLGAVVWHTHHQRLSNPSQHGYNVGYLKGVNPFDLGTVPTNDGVNHPADR